jgi:hypothetical protein
MILGIGLMIPARLPHSSNAFVVISQTIAGFGSGMLDIPISKYKSTRSMALSCLTFFQIACV